MILIASPPSKMSIYLLQKTQIALFVAKKNYCFNQIFEFYYISFYKNQLQSFLSALILTNTFLM